MAATVTAGTDTFVAARRLPRVRARVPLGPEVIVVFSWLQRGILGQLPIADHPDPEEGFFLIHQEELNGVRDSPGNFSEVLTDSSQIGMVKYAQPDLALGILWPRPCLLRAFGQGSRVGKVSTRVENLGPEFLPP